MNGPTNDHDTAGVPFPPPLAYLAGLGVGFALQRLVPLSIFRAAAAVSALKIAGVVLAATSLVLVVSTIMSFRVGGASPFLMRPTTSLVVRGPFRITRNPIYLSLALLHAGIALFFNAPWPLLLLLPAVLSINFLIIVREERYLQRRFGAEYEAYCKSVRRWL